MKFLLVTFLLVGTQLHAGSIIKCQAPDGSITFADTRCSAGQIQLSKKNQPQYRISKKSNLRSLQQGSEFPAEKKTSTIPTMMLQAKLTQVISSITPIKFKIIEYYMYRGIWPDKLDDLGFESKDMTSSLINQTALSESGRLQLKLADEFGEEKAIWLYPKEVMGGTQIEWDCYANFPADILKSSTGTPLCNSRYF